MKFMFLLVMMASCVQSHNEQQLNATPRCMSKEEVMNEINRPVTQKDFRENMEKEANDPKYLMRSSQLTPLNQLFEDSELKDYKKKRQEQAIDVNSLPTDVDLRQYASAIKDQWNGTCSAFGLIATEELAHCKFRGECGLDLSERHFWSYYKQYSAPKALKMSSNFVALEKVWPQGTVDRPTNIDKFAKYNVTENEYLGGDTQNAKLKVLKALADGYPVYFWSQTPNCMLSCAKTCSSKKNGFADGGHAYSVVGYFNKLDPILIIKNSWGEDCGDNGYQYLSFKIYDNSEYWEAASIKQVSIKGGEVPTPIPTIIPETPKTVLKCEMQWRIWHFWTKKEYCWKVVI